MIKNKYELASKPERDRILGTSFIPSYGPLPVHNVKFNKLVQYLEKLNNDLQVPDQSEYQKALKDTIKMQLNLSRLKILNDYALKEKKEGGAGSDVLSALSFRNWCGAGTPIYNNIKNNLDDPNKMFVIDRICRDHDIRYLQAKTRIEQKEADNIMIEEIYNEYVINFNRNFITGDYKTDFSTWTSSFYTVFNYLMTGIETAYTANVIKEIGIKAGQIAKFGYDVYRTYNPILDYPEGYFDDMPQILEAARDVENVGNPDLEQTIASFRAAYVDIPRAQIPYRVRGLYYRLKNNFSGIALTFVASTIIKDRIFALASLAAIGLKRMIETVTNYRFVDLTKHDVTDEDLENMIKVFETLQNQYLEQSNLKPIKIGDEWLNVAIEIPPIKTINDDIKIIEEQNKAYNELNKTMMETQPMPPAPVIEPSSEPIEKEIITSLEPLTEEELIRLNEYKKFNLYLEKIFNEDNFIISPEDAPRLETSFLPYPDLPSTDTVKEKEKLAPDIEKDIKEATPSSLLDLPDEENIDDEKIKQNEINSQEENDEKNKTEL